MTSQAKRKLKTISTQTISIGHPGQSQHTAPSKCLSHLDNDELEEYLRDSPTPLPSSEEEPDVDIVDETPQLSSKNRWMFNSSESDLSLIHI